MKAYKKGLEKMLNKDGEEIKDQNTAKSGDDNVAEQCNIEEEIQKGIRYKTETEEKQYEN